MTAKSKKVSLIDDSAMGIFQISSYNQRKFKAVYYALQETWGQTIQAQSKTNWNKANWEEFKSHFWATFGTVDHPKYSVEQIVEYSIKHFNKGLEELLEVNKRTWERRERLKQEALKAEPEII
ncbi:hypothetical protein WA1_50810 [Scytonema hofmannii PCC 7110]|uniref:Uncharacterized protein n=1 Tax=Scytonema hofmannii PCC 7110 TaxID=128403 RepID=A0A139WQ16_9CYAN|nr:hypothetical protein [Scytonema hofmannii]KYC34523.1 hypothetical protein WA1_50810 [Scytonema hofmannii PCC 7110]